MQLPESEVFDIVPIADNWLDLHVDDNYFCGLFKDAGEEWRTITNSRTYCTADQHDELSRLLRVLNGEG